MGYSFDFSQARCIPQSCLKDDKTCHEAHKQLSQTKDIKDFNEINHCYLAEIPGIFSDLRITQNTCICQGNNKVTYCFPFLQSPKDPTYPCSPKMLEYFAMQQKMRKFRCNQFIKNWNADQYECIFDKDSKKVDECYKTLRERYCGWSLN